MNYKFGIKAAVLLSNGIELLGATVLVVLLTSLFGQHTFWTGAACVIHGVLIKVALDGYILREEKRYRRDLVNKALEAVKAEKRGEEPCRFNDGGQCTYSEKPMACVREEDRNGKG